MDWFFRACHEVTFCALFSPKFTSMLPREIGACAWLEQVGLLSVFALRLFGDERFPNKRSFYLNEKSPKVKGKMHSRSVALDFRFKHRI